MPAKIRLQRRGKKGRPFYHIVIADGRAPRDGKFIEKIGIYNSIAKPAEIDLNIERALYWLQAGAVPTETVRSILSFKGVMYKYHLLKGVKKGALTEEQAEMKFQEWVREKQEKLLSKIREHELETKDERKKRLANEAKINEARAKELAAKREKELKAARAAETETQETEPAEAAEQEEIVAKVEEVTEIQEKTEAEEITVVEEVPETAEAEEVPETAEAEVSSEIAEAEVTPEIAEAEVTPEIAEAEEVPIAGLGADELAEPTDISGAKTVEGNNTGAHPSEH